MASNTPLLPKLAERLRCEANEREPNCSKISPSKVKQEEGSQMTRPFVLKFATHPLRTQRRQPPETIFTAVQRETTDDR